MKKEPRIIFFDGTRYCGITTQLYVLNGYLKQKQKNPKIFNINDDLDIITQWLDENPDSIVLVDGSIGYEICSDMRSRTPIKEIINNHYPIINKLESIDHKYGIVNILVLLNDSEEILRRQKKQPDMPEDSRTFDIVTDMEITNQMKFLNNIVVSKTLLFHTIEIKAKDKIIDIFEEIKDILKI